MITLSALTAGELAQVDTALTLIDAALELLLDRGVCDEDGIDLIDLAEAVAGEVEARALEDAEYKVGSAIKRGECVEVLRPDGQTGYAPSSD